MISMSEQHDMARRLIHGKRQQPLFFVLPEEMTFYWPPALCAACVHTKDVVLAPGGMDSFSSLE